MARYTETTPAESDIHNDEMKTNEREIVGSDGSIDFVVVDRWIPFKGYEARTVQGFDRETGERLLKYTQMRQVGEIDWFRAP